MREKKIALSSYFLTLKEDEEKAEGGEGEKGGVIHEDNPFGICLMDEGSSCLEDGKKKTSDLGGDLTSSNKEERLHHEVEERGEKEKEDEEQEEEKKKKTEESLDDLMAKMKALQS